MPVSLPSPAPADVSLGLLAVSYPGSVAPHFRVQVLTAETLPRWQLFATFVDRQLAEICLERLHVGGQTARLIAFRRVPTAA